MEYIAIDKELYNEIVATVSTASQEIREEYRMYQESVGSEWIENDELSRLLSLSKHQLKGYRGRGLLGYTMIGNKIYYTTSKKMWQLKEWFRGREYVISHIFEGNNIEAGTNN